MRFVFTLFTIIFTLLSLVEVFGGDFWLFRALNLFALISLWFALPRRACRPSPEVVPAVAMELDEEDAEPLPSV